jgi:hypothetical protein
VKIISAVLAILLFAAGAPAAPKAKSFPKKCDRACLNGAVDSYLAALVAHDPAKVRLSPKLEFVENTVDKKPGEGLWTTASALPTTFKIYVPDPVSQQVGFLGVMKESDKPILLALRLKLHGGRIIVAEHLIARDLRENSLKNLETPRPAFSSTVPKADQNSRDDMMRIAAMYYPALTGADSNNTPFADDCVRRENGMQTTGNPPPATPGGIASMGALGCKAQLKTGTFNYIKRIEPVRVMIADRETGLVFGLSQFRHPMKEKSLTITGVTGVTTIPMNFNPFDLPAAHIFKVTGGQIHQIEAMGFTMPYDSKTGWENLPSHGR